MNNLKIIDFEKKGNMVRFYLGDSEENDYYGDDWDDPYYDDNAGRVYDRYIKGKKDISFDFDDLVYEPADSYADGEELSKDDLKAGIKPCIIVIPKEVYEENNNYLRYWDYSDWVLIEDCRIKKYYFNDVLE